MSEQGEIYSADNVIHDVKNHLKLLKYNGLTHFYLDQETGLAESKNVETEELQGQEMSSDGKLDKLAKKVEKCRLCEIGESRDQLVFGVGSSSADLVFVGEAPGKDENRVGEPFVGRAGKLLNKMIVYMGLRREDVYIMNTLKCHPPGNRNPSLAELDNCKGFFDQQLAILQPKVIVALGTFAVQRLLNTDIGIGKLRGKFHDYNGIKVMATYHPAYLLRSPGPENRAKVKGDLRQVSEQFFGINDFPD